MHLSAGNDDGLASLLHAPYGSSVTGKLLAKLTDSDQEEIAKLCRKGMDQWAIAKLFGVTAGTICVSLKKMGVRTRRPGRRFFQIDADRRSNREAILRGEVTEGDRIEGPDVPEGGHQQPEVDGNSNSQ